MELKIILWIIAFLILVFICLWKTADRVTRLEALVELLEREIKAIHKNQNPKQ